MTTTRLFCLLASAATSMSLFADESNEIKNEQFNPIQTGVTTLSITPDARGSAMGNLGAATDPDINAQFWNPSKFAFAYSAGGIGLSYTPWLRKIVNDIFLADVSGFLKLGSSDNQAISASLRYFSLGEVIVNEAASQTINPYEFAIDFGYSRKLSEKFAMGVALRYILSDLAYEDSYSGEVNTAGSAFAVDLSGYYTTYPIIGRSECQWSWGFDISNIGSKVSYDHGANYYYLPTNLRLGTNFTFPLADFNLLSIGLDLNKLLVPTKPREYDYVNPGGSYYDPDKTEGENAQAFNDALNNWENMSPISGIFKSFSDAPGGLSEELKEINVSIGGEYAYNDQFFVRMGYNYENAMKGGRSYFGFGAGFSLNVVRLDASYVLATAQNSPLDQTMRFTLSFDMDGIRDLLGKRRR